VIGFVEVMAFTGSAAQSPTAKGRRENAKRLGRPKGPYSSMVAHPTPGLILQNPEEKGTFLVLRRLAWIIRFSFSGYINSGNYEGFLKRREKNI